MCVACTALMQRRERKKRQRTTSMAEASVGTGDLEIEDAPSNLRSGVWQHFGFPKRENEKGEKTTTDKTKTICKHCKKEQPYSNSTTNMKHHLDRHHSEKLSSPPTERKKILKGQTMLTSTFGAPLAQKSARAKEITKCIAVFMAKDMRPFSVVENEGFRLLINTLEPKYHIPSRQYFSQTEIPALYKQTKEKVIQTLRQANSIAITTDGWTSRATESFITITAHVITDEWEMLSFVLQTRPLYEAHTGVHIAEILRSAVAEWELERAACGIGVVTDNARNMDVAVREAGLAPHVKCFAHTLNLASQAGLSVPRVHRLLGRVRRVVAFFHRSTTAAAVLTSNQKAMELPQHKLIIDVVTRWNSSLDMLERYLKHQSAVAATLLSPYVRRNAREIDTLDHADINDAEDIVKLLKPMKTATTVLSDEKTPTVSLIVPLKHMIESSMAPNEEDSATVSAMKRAILDNLSNRYTDVYDWLLECTALDPRFRTLPHLEEDLRQDVFRRLREKAVQLSNKTNVTMEEADEGDGGEGTSGPTPAAEQPVNLTGTAEEAEVEQPPPNKKTALEDLLGGTFTEPAVAESQVYCIESEMAKYKNGKPISLKSCPLEWWKENAKIMYPLLSPLAKAYLSIPATSVPSERVFSTAGDIVNVQRSQLLADNVDMLIFLKKNM